MLTVITFLPLAVAVVLLLMPRTAPAGVFAWTWIVTAAVDLTLVIATWLAFKPDDGVQFEQKLAWIPQAGVGYHVGVDGLSR